MQKNRARSKNSGSVLFFVDKERKGEYNVPVPFVFVEIKMKHLKKIKGFLLTII